MSINNNYPFIPNGFSNNLIGTFILSQQSVVDYNPNLYLNNSVFIPWTTQGAHTLSTAHSNACIYLKDTILCSNGNIRWQQIKASDNDLYFSNSMVLTEITAADILSNIYLHEPSNVSNIIVSGGYINFFNGNNKIQGSNGVGIRYSNEHVQFHNYADSQWYDITTLSTANISDLNDVEITGVINNQYLRWNGSSSLWVNSNLTLQHDPIPTLGANLSLNNYQFLVENNSNVSFFDKGGNKILQIRDTSNGSGMSNYMILNNSITGSNPIISGAGDDVDVGITLQPKGSGNIDFNCNGGGNVYISAGYLEVSGFNKSSIYRSSSKSGGYNPSSVWNIPISSDTILLDFDNSNSAGTYWANVGAGIEGQKLNFIMHNSGIASINMLVDFGNNKLGSGNGLATKLKFLNSGQGASLIYLGTPAIWQILNTGAIIL